MSFGLQYFFYDTPFGPVPPTEVHDEEERLGFGAGKSKESFSQGSSDDAKKEVIKPAVSSNPTEQHQTINISNPRASNGELNPDTLHLLGRQPKANLASSSF
jgi:hypothetical protein